MVQYYMNNFTFYQALDCPENKFGGKMYTLNAKDNVLPWFLIAE